MSPDPTGYCVDDIFFLYYSSICILCTCFQGKRDWTCLHTACCYGHRDIVGDLIVKYKCDKEKVNKV